MKSIRRYLLTRLVAGAGLVLALTGLGVYLAVAHALGLQFDRNLTDRVRGFASILFQVEDRVDFQFSEQLMPEYNDEEYPAYFELWFEDGTLLERSESLAGRDLSAPIDVGREPGHWTAPLPDGRAGRFIAQRIEVHHVYPEEGPDRPQARVVRVVIATGREDLLAAERKVLGIAALSILVLIGLVAGITWLAVERGLAPARRFATQLDEIQVEALPDRFEPGELPRELVPVARKTAALVERVRIALDRERRTTADIAHELRTPLSEILTVSEVALRSNGAADPGPALATVRDVAARMGRSVTTLLKLARLEMGAESFLRAEIDLAAIVGQILPSLAATARRRSVRITFDMPADARILADADVVRIVLSNLLGNAVHYASEGSPVTCRLECADGWRLIVENESKDLCPADLESLTEPFWRKDAARADRERSGLGLALSRALAEHAGLQLLFELEKGRFRAILAG